LALRQEFGVVEREQQSEEKEGGGEMEMEKVMETVQGMEEGRRAVVHWRG
jgi:hypothetical protein